MFRTVPLSITRSFSLYTRQRYVSFRYCWQLASRIQDGTHPDPVRNLSAITVWHIPLLCVQRKTPDDGHKNCPKHVDFYSKNKYDNLVHLFGFIIRIFFIYSAIWLMYFDLPQKSLSRKSLQMVLAYSWYSIETCYSEFFHIAITFNIHNLLLCIIAAMGERFISFMKFSFVYVQYSNARRITYIDLSAFFFRFISFLQIYSLLFSTNSGIVIGIYEAYSEGKYRFAVKKNRVRFRIKFYCYQILHSSNYFSTYSPPLLRHLS